MRSLFAKILLLFLGTILVSLAAYVATSSFLVKRFGHDGFHSHTIALIRDEARRTYEEGGPEQLALCLKRFDSILPARHILTDAAGRDLVSGEDRSALLAQAHSAFSPFPIGERLLPHPKPHPKGERLVLVQATDDLRYRLISILRPRMRRRVWDFWPFYLLILLVITFLSYILAVHLVRPLRKLRRTVERFGWGDLSARSCSTRKDEIGDQSRAFDRMAERIETLLHAERRLLQAIR
jgi:methyl-accepting chemotaxis protein